MIKSKLLILLILLSLLMPLASASIPIYPPSANIQQGYQAGTASCNIGASTITFSIPTSMASNGETYAVTTTAIDLRNISYISISWRGVFGSIIGGAVFGISNNQMDASFVTSTTKSSSFSTTTTRLDVSNYYGDYYIKFGGYSLLSVFADTLYIYTYGVNLYNFSSTYPTPVTNIQQTTATLNGYAEGDGVIHTGFWYGNQTPSQATVDSGHCINTSVGERLSPTSFSKAVTDLTQYELYQVKSWSYNPYSSAFNVSNNISYFIPLPSCPTNFQVSEQRAKSINLSFTPTSVPVTFNSSTIIRYSTITYPTTITSGTLGANTTESYVLISGLDEDTTYYFSAFTWINQSDVEQFSTLYSIASGMTSGGIYNITVRYEDNLTLVAATTMANLEHTCTGRLRTGQLLSITFPNINPFLMNFTTKPNVFFFDFKNLTLRRAITPETGERNITFYVSDRPEYETGFNETECQLLYTFSFEDMTNYFRVSNQSKLYVYKFNGAEKFYIHQDYWSAEGTVDVPLQYGERYYIGVWCPLLYIPLVQYFDALDTTAPVIFISEALSTNESIYKYVFINFSWDRGGNGLWVNYTDSSFNTNSFTITIYQIWHTNSTRLLRNTTTWSLNQKDFHWTLTDGCNNSKSYYVKVEIDHKLFTTNQTMSSLYFPQISAITNPTWIDDWFELILGDSPFVDTDPDSSTYDQFVPWTHIIAFGVCLLLLMTIGHINMELSMIGVGFLLVILEVLLGVVITRDVGLTTVGVLGGVLLILLGFIMALGGGSRQK